MGDMMLRNASPSEDYARRLARARNKGPSNDTIFDRHESLRNAATIDDVTGLLLSSDRDLVISSLWLLGRLGGRVAARALRSFVNSAAETKLQELALESLGHIRLKRNGEFLCRMLESDRDERVRERAASALRSQDVTPAMTHCLVAVLRNTSESTFVREMVAEVLLCHPEEATVPALTEAMSDPASSVRYWAISSLSFTHAFHLIPQLELIAETDYAEAPEPDFNPPGYVPPRVCEVAREVISKLRFRMNEDSAVL